MLQNIWLGAPGMNTYQGMHKVLNKLGITPENGIPHQALAPHQNHFHADIRPMDRVDLPRNLNAAQYSQEATAPLLMLPNEAIAELRQDFCFTEEMTMFIPDMPNVPDQYLPVLVAESRQAATSSASNDFTFGVCRPVPNIPGLAIGREHEISPVSTAGYFLWSFDDYFKQMPEAQRRTALDLLESTAKITILQQPKYGTLTDTAKPAFQDPINGLFYNPKPGYMGKDQVILLVEMGKYKISIIYNLYPVDSAPDGSETLERVCGKRGMYYKISAAGDQLASWINTTQLGEKLVNAGISLSIADLTGSALGQTTGSTITLDANAAGYNWFIDASPLDNSEFLPTSNPYEWVAKEGTSAYGKMDMLSVLLHEYGHALGIEHSADSHDYMATTLTAGVRRMPSAEELALMQSLVAQAKTTLTESTLPLQGGGASPPCLWAPASSASSACCAAAAMAA